MLKIINPTKLTRQPFFQDLINYLWTHEDVTLRQIKKEFPDEKNLDRQLEQYIQAGYIIRKDRRYSLGIDLPESMDDLEFGQEVCVDTESSVYPALQGLSFNRQITNTTNVLVIEESVDFMRERLTLDSYFYKLKTQEAFSTAQQPLYQLLGDVNPDYALKYMTTFLLKFTRKKVVIQRRPDIFVQALVILGYILPVDDQSYRLNMELDREHLIFRKR